MPNPKRLLWGLAALGLACAAPSSRAPSNVPEQRAAPVTGPLPPSTRESRSSEAPPPASSDAPAREPPVTAGPSAGDPPPPEERQPAVGGASAIIPCGTFECRRFSSAADAVRDVLATEPIVIGIGEAHALAGTEGVRPTARRFAEEVLPVFEDRASHLIVELWSPNPKCARTTERVAEAQKPVTQGQSRSMQNDYVALGHAARSLGVEPFLLSPTCDELLAIAAAGDDAVPAMLRTVAQVTDRMLRAALVKNGKAGRRRMVLAYGGAMHNDLGEGAARDGFSFGPSLEQFTAGRYVELDLIVREFIKDNAAWRALPWYGSFDPREHPDAVVLLRIAPQRYVLFFPRSDASASPPPPSP